MASALLLRRIRVHTSLVIFKIQSGHMQMAWCQAAAPFLLPASGSLWVPTCDTKARFDWLDAVQVSMAPGPL